MTDKTEVSAIKKVAQQSDGLGEINLFEKNGDKMGSIVVFPAYKGEDVTDITDLIYRTLVKGLISEKSQERELENG